jgi:hypothetical protein
MTLRAPCFDACSSTLSVPSIDLRIEHRIDRTPHVHLSGEVEHDRRLFVAKNPFELGIFYIQFVELGRLGTFFRFPVTRLSTTTTSCPSWSKRSTTCDPINPAPP